MITLKPLSGKAKPAQPFFVFDIESKNWVDFLVLGFYDGNHYRYFDSIEEFLVFLFVDMRFDKIKGFAHFGGIFDFLFILKSALVIPQFRVEKIIARGSGLLSFDLIFHDTDYFPKPRIITFSDSSAFLPYGLKKLSESFGVDHKKQEWDHSKTDKITPELLSYLESDCKGLYEVIHKYQTWELIKKAGPKSTIASQALQVLRLFLKKQIPALCDEVDAFIRKSYVGGRTEIFKPLFIGKIDTLIESIKSDPKFTPNDEKVLRENFSEEGGTIKCFDVNSLYPTIMRDNKFPTRFTHSTIEGEPDSEFGFSECLVDVPTNLKIPPLPLNTEINKTTKLIFPVGQFWGVWSIAEIRYAETLGVKVLKWGKTVHFRSDGYIFKDFINTLYTMRLEAKKNNDLVQDTLTKLLMNSCYGRFGLNKEREEIVIDDGTEGLTPLEPDYVIKTSLGDVRFMLKDKKIQTFTNVAVAAWVTSLSRIYMHKIFMKNPDSIYYTDTDSLFTKDEYEEGKELGALKKEYEGDLAIFLLPKTYMIDSIQNLKDDDGKPIHRKFAMKGFDKRRIGHFTIGNFFEALEGELRVLSQDGEKKMARFKTALKKGDFLTLISHKGRQIRSRYDKRTIKKINNQYDSDPLVIHKPDYPFDASHASGDTQD